MAKNYYDILGVGKSASQDEIKKAYRKLAHQYHPDKQGGDEAKFKEINEAYSVLSDGTKRSQYDQFGQTFNGAGSGGGAGFGGFDFGNFSGQQGGFHFDFGGSGGFEDLFSEMFGGGGRSGARTRSRSGADIHVDVEISFEEMATGVSQDIPLRKSSTCEVCHGSGGRPGSEQKTCSTCQGSGQVRRAVRSILGVFSQVEVCETCQGRGKVYTESCNHCHGKGRFTTDQKIRVDIPAGIQSGQAISLSGQGEAGDIGAPAGDLLITVRVKPHTSFERKGDDVFSSAEISFARAALGDTLSIATLEGSVKIKVPAGTQSGELFRIRDKGIPHLGKRGQGDHFVRVKVVTPTKLSRAQKKLLEQLKETEND